ncbi:hypothetical protein CVT26_007715 [Gymnopilus dilepis]|uniref:Uncharacterized protein n=1 Tax=Gymnopilus dilepis TaxID=231916 RepID=A0A409WWL8_9AGAR|nr:hypothetical protein CVT26_007715 [Gymnopilus dilepis]
MSNRLSSLLFSPPLLSSSTPPSISSSPRLSSASCSICRSTFAPPSTVTADEARVELEIQ